MNAACGIEADGDLHEFGLTQLALDKQRVTEAVRALGPIEPLLAAVLTNLNLRVYAGHSGGGDRCPYVVLDIHGVSIGVQRRENDLYVHLDTSEITDQLIAVEINGGGEIDHPIH